MVYAEPDSEVFVPDTQSSTIPVITPQGLPQATPDWYIQSEVYTQIGADIGGQWIKAQPQPQREAFIAILDSGIDVTSPILEIHKLADG